MYEDLFDRSKQLAMRRYFYEIAHTKGIIKNYKKNSTINLEDNNFIGIVTKGVLSQNIISMGGNVHLLYLLRRGEIFGETYYFCDGENNISTIVKEDAEVSYILRGVLDEELRKNPEIHRYFIHSITRKFRIVMLQLTNKTFNNSIGKIANTLLRLSACSETDPLGRNKINMMFTHQELANNIGCSRITVTNCLNKFLSENIISYEQRKIVINKPEILKKYVDLI